MKFLSDLAERVLATYVATFLGLLVANGFDLTDLTAVKAAAIASIPAALTIVKGALAKYVGDLDTAGFVNTKR